MVRLYGAVWSKEQLLARVGNVSQVGGIRLSELTEGPGRGMRIAEIVTGSGLNYTVVIDRCMDIGRACMSGVPLAWVSPGAEVAPSFHDPYGTAWLRTFGGGLLATCGLLNAGAAGEDMGEHLGLHGRIGAAPAGNVSISQAWFADDYVMSLTGTMREWQLFGENVTLTRNITSRLGDNTISVRDTVTNEGHARVPHMLLYHMNLGWPLISEYTRLEIRGTSAIPRDDEARSGLEGWWRMDAPTQGYKEQVFYHEVSREEDGSARIRVVNPTLPDPRGMELTLEYKSETSNGLAGLTRFTQWKQMGMGAYTLGLEPANCHVEGRERERMRGTLEHLEPGESRTYAFNISARLG